MQYNVTYAADSRGLVRRSYLKDCRSRCRASAEPLLPASPTTFCRLSTALKKQGKTFAAVFRMQASKHARMHAYTKHQRQAKLPSALAARHLKCDKCRHDMATVTQGRSTHSAIFALSRAATVTCAPRDTNALLKANPMPLLAPVTMTFFPFMSSFLPSTTSVLLSVAFDMVVLLQ